VAYYNVQKRNTLDRLTVTYQLRMREILRRESEKQIRDFYEAIQSDHRTFKPDFKGLEEKVLPIFENHRDRVIHVGVSDGIQEVSPDHELGLWMNFPVGMPIEDTLSTDLAVKRDKIVRVVKKTTIARNTSKVKDLTSDLLDAYLKNIKEAYKAVSASWIEGESSVKDVISGLRESLRKTDNDSERIFRTETTNYFNRSRHDYFSDNTSVDYMELYAVTDGRISKICEDRHGAVITIAEASKKEFMPAFHPNCRTIQRPLISALSSHKKIIDAGLLITARKASWTPDAWHRHAS
jgi:SPP1 gp7 family putative phage head morphogenesis protein